jgi:GT2 family glycosyltransferase
MCTDGRRLAEAEERGSVRRNTARLATLMACHNRVSSTMASVRSLMAQQEALVAVDLFLVDDGSSDGTEREIAEICPQARILRGDGTLFWNGGMHLAFAEALRADYDFYFWLNDDTNLETDAIARVVETYRQTSAGGMDAVIVVGSTKDPVTGLFSYGGWRTRNRWWGTRSWEKFPPSMEKSLPCDTLNGNCVLIPRSVAKVVGNVDPVFIQGFGDLDYGLRARASGCRITVAPGYVGTCRLNEGPDRWKDRSLSIRARWRSLIGPKGLPMKPLAAFTRRHKGPLWPVSWIAPYAIFWFGVMLSVFRK